MKRLAIALLALVLAGCGGPKKTVESLRGEIAEYKANPSDEQQAKIESHFAELDAEIDALEQKGSTADAAVYRASEENLRSDYRAARMVRTMKKAQHAVQEVGEAFKEAGKSIGDIFKKSEDPAATPEP